MNAYLRALEQSPGGSREVGTGQCWAKHSSASTQLTDAARIVGLVERLGADDLRKASGCDCAVMSLASAAWI
ncbi:MAG: hypothetical protein ABI895_21510 [Deltaproteobacteria bacterium]